MKMICKIAKTELRNLFYSPVAWFLTVAFLIQCAVFYCGVLVSTARWMDVAKDNMPKFRGFGVPLTKGLFLAGDSIFSNALQNLYLFVPLLTMGLISREVNNGTIKLLYSSPVRTRDIVLGKYLAIMLYNVLLVAIVSVFVIMGIMHIQDADYGLLLSGILGFYLLVCAFTAIGLFMSSLTNYQIVSAIASFIVIWVLVRIGGLWQKYDFVRDLTYFLSLNGRTAKMLGGLITSKDVIYFVLIIGMFISFTIIKLKSGRESKQRLVNAARYISIIVVVLAVGYFTSRPALTLYWDTTANKENTLHPDVQKIVKDMNASPLEITLYTNLTGGGAPHGFPENRNEYLSTVWERYLRFKPDIKFNYVYFYDTADGDSTLYKTMPGKSLPEIAKQVAKGFDQPLERFMPPAEIRKIIDLKEEGYRVVMELKYNGHRTFLRTYDDPNFWPEDNNIAPALKRLQQAKMPKLLFLTGDLERSIFKKGEREYQRMVSDKGSRGSLVNLGFDADTISAGTEIPADITTLIVADPKTELTAATQDQIAAYLNKGGNMMVMGEIGKQQILNPVLRHVGAQFEEGTLVEVSKHEKPDMIKPYTTKEMLGLANDGISKSFAEMQAGGDTLELIPMSGTVSVTYADTSGFKGTVLLATRPGRDWLRKGALVTDSAAPVFTPALGDSKVNSYATAISLARKVGVKEQRIIVSGDADFFSSLRQEFLAVVFAQEMFSWLCHGEFPVYAPRSQPKDTILKVGLTGANTVKLVFVWILPAVITLLGTILLIRRKRQ
ncbi:Gldg family protein [Chitinophaga sp. 212800010-3]|uniref:Gldg family protein n=1 Tax=unclassified Chitinophaga TaxID=2619133 RepID=UPI002DEB3115|nr:ABC-transp-aux domain-containing protein [Chitinophaga sp. 212800010-3]